MTEKKNIIDVDESNFNEKIIEASEKKLIIVDFWAPWCGPCKQLTPLLEKVVNKGPDKIVLAKVNIDENQQVATQLRIQSIPAVFAFKNKKIVNGFQGVITEKQIIEFIEKSLGEKLEEDFSEFFKSIEKSFKEKNFDLVKDELLNFIANKPKELRAISFYLSCLIELEDYNEAKNFFESLDEEISSNEEIRSAMKLLEIKKNNTGGTPIESLLNDLNNQPNNINVLYEIADKFFANNEYSKAFEILIEHYPKNKEKIKEKILEFFSALGHSHEETITYRKKLSQIMFS